MVAILEKSEHNIDFHPMVDFIEASPLKIKTIEEGTQILVTVDGIHRTVTESSLRRNLKFKDEEGIGSVFPSIEDRATIDKSSTLPHDSALRVTFPAAVEAAQEVEINRLKERVKLLEDREGVAATGSGDDTPIKGRSIDEREAATERISDDLEEMATVLTSMDAATVLASGVVDVPTSSGSIPTASTPAEERRKGKEVMVESETPKKQTVQEQIDAQVARELEEKLEREDQRRSEQIARDAEIARIHAE
nr:hypothetical protein [Tanacetum cinerariifolium]